MSLVELTRSIDNFCCSYNFFPFKKPEKVFLDMIYHACNPNLSLLLANASISKLKCMFSFWSRSSVSVDNKKLNIVVLTLFVLSRKIIWNNRLRGGWDLQSYVIEIDKTKLTREIVWISQIANSLSRATKLMNSLLKTSGIQSFVDTSRENVVGG